MKKIAQIFEPKLLLFSMGIAVVILAVTLTPMLYYFWEIDVFFSNSHIDFEQGKLMAAVNSQKMSKGSKNTSSNVRNRLKSTKISNKDLLCTKM